MDIRQHACTDSHVTTYVTLWSGLGPPRPRRPLAFVQPCPVGVTPLQIW